MPLKVPAPGPKSAFLSTRSEITTFQSHLRLEKGRIYKGEACVDGARLAEDGGI